MFKKRKLLSFIAVALTVSACGGGGSSSGNVTAPAATVNSKAVPSDVGAPAATADSKAVPSDAGAQANSAAAPAAAPTPTQPAPTPSATVTPTALDQQLNGYFEMVANQILYIRTNRVIYLPVDMSLFEGNTGIVDLASGSAVTPIAGLEEFAASQGCNAAADGVCGIQPSAAAPAAPIAGFGIRIDRVLHEATAGQSLANQTVVGRIAFDLTELSDSPGIAAGETAEIMRFVIDNVEMATDQNGQLTSFKVRTDSRLHLYGRNAAGTEVRQDLPVPQGAVRLLPMADIPDRGNDTSSVILYMDLELAFSQGGTSLAALEKIAGHFAMHVTLSSISRIFRPAAAATSEVPAVGAKDLVGQEITVNDEKPVNGAGINGSAWIRMYPNP